MSIENKLDTASTIILGSFIEYHAIDRFINYRNLDFETILTGVLEVFVGSLLIYCGDAIFCNIKER